MKTEILLPVAIYLASVINLIIASWLYRKTTRINRDATNEINHAMEMQKQIEKDLKQRHGNDIEVQFLTKEEFFRAIGQSYQRAIHPAQIVRGMSYDDFIDWLEIGTIEDVKCAREVFAEHNMQQHVRIIDGWLENKNTESDGK